MEQLKPLVTSSAGSVSTGGGAEGGVLIAAVELLPGETYTFEFYCAMFSALAWSKSVCRS